MEIMDFRIRLSKFIQYRYLRSVFFLCTLLGAGVTPLWGISGGQVVPERAFPWMAALVNGTGATPRTGHFCSGMLIHPSWVLTAAHCVKQISPDEFEVVLGLDGLTQSPTAEQRYRVVEMVLHERYFFRDGQHDGDLALLRLDRPVDGIEPVRLFEGELTRAESFAALGWDHTNAARTLHQLDVDVLERLEASAATGEGFFLDGLPAYSGTEDLGICYGDSGGPLLVDVEGQWQLVGVTSYVIGQCSGYAVFANLVHHREWIMGYVFPEFAEWQAEHALASGLWGDDDGDGLINFAEFALVSDPQSGRASPMGLSIDPSNQATLSFLRRSDVAFAVEHSLGLKEWNPLGAAFPPQRVPVIDFIHERVTVPGLAVEGAGFFRVQSRPHWSASSVSASHSREFYSQGDVAGWREDPETGRREWRYRADGLPNATTRFIFQAAGFSPLLQVRDASSGELLMEAGEDGNHSLNAAFQSDADTTYELRLSSVEDAPEGDYYFYYPNLLNPPSFLQLGLQPVQGTLSVARSGFDGNYYRNVYEILGGIVGNQVTLTMISDPEAGGFRPFLAVTDQNNVLVTQTEGNPETETTLSFVIEPSKRYYAFASTLFPGEVGTFTLSGFRE